MEGEYASENTSSKRTVVKVKYPFVVAVVGNRQQENSMQNSSSFVMRKSSSWNIGRESTHFGIILNMTINPNHNQIS